MSSSYYIVVYTGRILSVYYDSLPRAHDIYIIVRIRIGCSNCENPLNNANAKDLIFILLPILRYTVGGIQKPVGR